MLSVKLSALLNLIIEVILCKIMMSTHQKKCVIGISTTRELGEIVVCQICLALGGRVHGVCLVSTLTLLVQPFLGVLYVSVSCYIWRLVVGHLLSAVVAQIVLVVLRYFWFLDVEFICSSGRLVTLLLHLCLAK